MTPVSADGDSEGSGSAVWGKELWASTELRVTSSEDEIRLRERVRRRRRCVKLTMLCLSSRVVGRGLVIFELRLGTLEPSRVLPISRILSYMLQNKFSARTLS
jgi:hypothetical protein